MVKKETQYKVIVKIIGENYEAKGRTIVDALYKLNKEKIKGLFRYQGVITVEKGDKSVYMMIKPSLRVAWAKAGAPMAIKIASESLMDKLTRR